MITFFRRVREQLIGDGKVGRYLLYAIGEMLLVVIGILIALQVNNWNEEQQKREREKFLLINLRNDFQTRYTELQEINTAREEAIEIVVLMNRMIAGQLALPADEEMDTHLATFVNYFGFNEQFKMLDVLFTTGQINEISNEELKQQLLLWPQQMEEMLEEQRDVIWLYQNVLRPLYYEYISMRAVNESFEFRNYNLPKGEPVSLTKDYEGLLKDRLFENYLADLQILLRINILDGNTLIESADRIIELLDQEIESRE